MFRLKNYRTRAKGLPDLLPYAALIAPDVLLLKDGSLMVAWEVRGADTESCTQDELAVVSARVNQALRHLGSGWMLQVDALRLPATDYPAPDRSHFPDAVTRMMDDARRKTFGSGHFFTTTTVFTVCWKPRAEDAKLKKLTHNKEETRADVLEQSLELFRKSLLVIEDNLSMSLNMERLGSVETEEGIFSPLLSFIQLCLIGEEYLPRLPLHSPMYLDAVLGGQDLVGGLSPRIGKKHLAVISLDGLPSESWPSMLSTLASFPFPSRFSTRFICLDKFEALKEVDKYRKTWSASVFRFLDKLLNKVNPRPDRDALAMTQDAEAAYEGLQGDYFGAGLYTSTVVLLDDNPEMLGERVRLVRRALMNVGFGSRVEEINAVEAWLGTHPGNSTANVRRPMLSTLNLSDFLPLASIWTGSQFCPCPFYQPESPALIQCATDDSTPFWLNLHSGDLGHTLIIGPTGAGKSTLLATFAAQFRRYRRARVIAFDKGMSLLPLCLAVGGQHYDVGGDGSPSFQPFVHLETEADRVWAEDWIAMLCNLQLEKDRTIGPGHRAAIHDTVEQLANTEDVGKRTLSTFVMLVPSLELKEALRHYTVDGGMGKLLDAKQDGLTNSAFTVFEIEKLMDMGEINLLPVLTYLFRHIERGLDGRPVFLLLDEAWIMLGNAFFKAKIREWMKVMRKNNVVVILATQSLSDADRSGIMDVLLESCPTKILLPNDKARESVSVPFYQAIGLNERQIDLIADARPKREYYIVQPEGRRMVNLALSSLELAFVGASDKESLARVRELHTAYGAGWTQHWLKERGVAV